MLNFTLFPCLSLFSSPWTRPPPASFCLNSVKTTSIHFLSYLFRVSTLCNSSDDRIPNEVTMVLMHFFCHNPFMVKLREHQVPEIFALTSKVCQKQTEFFFSFSRNLYFIHHLQQVGKSICFALHSKGSNNVALSHAPILALTW